MARKATCTEGECSKCVHRRRGRRDAELKTEVGRRGRVEKRWKSHEEERPDGTRHRSSFQDQMTR